MREVLSSVNKELCPVAFHEITALDFGPNGNSADSVA